MFCTSVLDIDCSKPLLFWKLSVFLTQCHLLPLRTAHSKASCLVVVMEQIFVTRRACTLPLLAALGRSNFLSLIFNCALCALLIMSSCARSSTGPRSGCRGPLGAREGGAYRVPCRRHKTRDQTVNPTTRRVRRDFLLLPQSGQEAFSCHQGVSIVNIYLVHS